MALEPTADDKALALLPDALPNYLRQCHSAVFVGEFAHSWKNYFFSEKQTLEL